MARAPDIRVAGRDPDEALLAIDALLRHYVHCLDDGRFEEWPEFFTDPCRYLIMPRASHEAGHVSGFYLCESRGMLQDRITCLRETQIYEPQVYRHTISATRIVDANGEEVRAETNFLVVRTAQDGAMTLFAAGKYLDTVIFDRAGAPKFREKLVITDSRRIDMLLAAPI